MTGPYSWLDAAGREYHYSPEVGNIATRVDATDMTIDDLPDPDEPFTVDPSEEVRYAIQHAAPGGGLVIATGNVLQPGTSLENYLAARQATRDYGQYPIVVDRR